MWNTSVIGTTCFIRRPFWFPNLFINWPIITTCRWPEKYLGNKTDICLYYACVICPFIYPFLCLFDWRFTPYPRIYMSFLRRRSALWWEKARECLPHWKLYTAYMMPSYFLYSYALLILVLCVKWHFGKWPSEYCAGTPLLFNIRYTNVFLKDSTISREFS